MATSTMNQTPKKMLPGQGNAQHSNTSLQDRIQPFEVCNAPARNTGDGSDELDVYCTSNPISTEFTYARCCATHSFTICTKKMLRCLHKRPAFEFQGAAMRHAAMASKSSQRRSPWLVSSSGSSPSRPSTIRRKCSTFLVPEAAKLQATAQAIERQNLPCADSR